jgi:hypothetical protein
MRFWALLAILTGGGVLVGLSACTPGRTGTGPVDGSIEDAPSDANSVTDVNDADDASDAALDGGDAGDAATEAGCPGLICNGNCITANDCSSCPGAPLLCAATSQCTADCQGCNDSNGAAMAVQCFACDSNHQNPIGTCQYADAGSYCLSGNYLGVYHGGNGYHCGCNDVAACPGGTQVCVPLGNQDAGFCLACGEISLGSTQGLPCKNGTACVSDHAACE